MTNGSATPVLWISPLIRSDDDAVLQTSTPADALRIALPAGGADGVDQGSDLRANRRGAP
jgi:hypothetical protein